MGGRMLRVLTNQDGAPMTTTLTGGRHESTQTRPYGPSGNAFRALIRSFGQIRRVMEPYFANFGISASQWGVLRALHRSEEEGLRTLRLADLGERLLVRPPSVTGALDRLQRMGLIQRRASTTDRRVKYVKLAPAGRRLVRRVLARHDDQIQKVLEGLNVEEQEQLRLLLDRLGTHLYAMARQDEQGGK